MKRSFFFIALLVAAGLSALVSWIRQVDGPSRCALDGSRIEPCYEVEIIVGDQPSRRFSCVLNAKIWLSRNQAPVEAVWVRDEGTGERIRAEQAFFVSSAAITTPHTGNRIHAFARIEEATAHARQFNGTFIEDPLLPTPKPCEQMASYQPDSPHGTGVVSHSLQEILCLWGDRGLIPPPGLAPIHPNAWGGLAGGHGSPPYRPPRHIS